MDDPGLASNHDSVPSPQRALGTSPRLSVRKKARIDGGMEWEEEKIGGKGREENVQGRTAEVRDGRGRETERQNTFTPQNEKKGSRGQRREQDGGVKRA